ncbi:hypothetical protein LTR28_005956 [Elasticomyces elasticus]|nr:hypothetical protein LTR28_005956 [Elasticomyces elasticus]KAK4993679.1 transcription initiation factor IIB [Elasticomyces elasticus]
MTTMVENQALSPGQVLDEAPSVTDAEWQENLNIRMICPDCREDPPNIREYTENGDTVCMDCGRVLGARLVDMRSEWRTFANDDQGNDDPSRVGDGPNSLLNGSQLNTNIAFGDGSMRSKELHRAQSKSTHDKTTKSLLTAYKSIGTYCDAYALPTMVADGAKHIYKDAEESRIFKGKNQEALIAGCIFIACRRNNVPRTFREIHEMTNVEKKEIGRTFKTLERFLLKQQSATNKVTATGAVMPSTQESGSRTTNPTELCARFCSILGLDHRVTSVAQALASQMSNIGSLAGRSPLSGAAACIYMASHLMNQPRLPKAISDAAKVSDSTIRNAYKFLYQARDEIIDKEWLEKGGDMARLPRPS